MKLKVTKKLVICVSLLIILILITLSGSIMSQVNEPKYKLISSEGNVEVREYSPILVAQVLVIGERKSAISAGFKILANYIFGNNEGRKKISMTAPVIQQEGEKISMTAPVIQQELNDNLHWNVRFVMPFEYTIETLPRPKNNQVEIIPIPSKALCGDSLFRLGKAKCFTKESRCSFAIYRVKKTSWDWQTYLCLLQSPMDAPLLAS